MSFADDLIKEAPTFKDLLGAIMDERRNHIKDSDTYKHIEQAIKDKCEEAARDLSSYILLGDLGLSSNSALFKSIKYKFSPNMLLDTIKCVCKKLELEFDGTKISWGKY